MLNATEIRTLASWCAARQIRWQPVSRAHLPAILLERMDVGGCWARMLLSIDRDDFELVTENGEPLASSSDLHSVLDALEGGVAEGTVPPPAMLPAWKTPMTTRAPSYVV